MKLVKDLDGTILLCNGKVWRNETYNEWHATNSIPYTKKWKETNEDGSYCYYQAPLTLPNNLSGITWENEPIEVCVKRNPNGNMWVCRNEDGSLSLCLTEPYKNSLHPWWSATCKITDNELIGFSDLTWADEPVKVSLIKKPTITIIAAVTNNLALGKDNKLLYHLPDDMKHFKELTTGNTVIMGRKTFESFPMGALPNRRNIVISKSDVTYPNTEVYHSLDEAILAALNDNIFIIGGGSIYEQSLKYADVLEMTVIDDIYEDADTFFPEWKNYKPLDRFLKNCWKKTNETKHEKDEKHQYSFCFETWKR